MEIQHVEMDRISDQNSRTTVSPLQGYAPHASGGKSAMSKNGQGDTFIMDNTRQYIRQLCSNGNVMQHIDEILNSGIEPDCLRAELAFRASRGEKPACEIIISYLSGNFKQAEEQTNLLLSSEQGEKLKEFLIFSDYFAGRFERACQAAQDCPALNYSPFLCYTYAEMLLSLGYIELAREYTRKYVVLAKKYLKNFVSEKEKYDEQKKRREQNSRRNKQDKNKSGRNEGNRGEKNSAQTLDSNEGEQSPALYTSLKDLLSRRRILITTLKTRNLNIDKKPLLFELEDIDAKIASMNGKNRLRGL
ncbi:hypothetical protein CCDG5_0930 [[Clostridium] cellulosi]|uniref:Uncharacterized protein n=1 Tax=[Clostridium] cellulosi TaxID=29343 RepID=A0A078KSF3_9FIRM|nr:MAG: hypothetical protein DIU81_06885 [[Clostridium] cellulosi]CDZ24049.1 hypothetical protein CCDG5_0930 [[Clostridium] cellulosi]